MKINLMKLPAIYGMAGALAGYFLLHPASMFIHSIGVAVFPEDGRSVDEMVGKAGAALYIAKDLGRNRVVSG
ncbi:MAG: hypothetical protein A2509_10780 [Candidatus Edwardsbacteria bacterium RIFOXYD12_FULL_50_11]|jgi:GGDEF domain-containing protein|uniref:GGDEF domain-containing protein n=1 Tax=Candidatus Edwardsbacteria bacterium GWF2_54_11 TaxID=1817851 RepID=A0A1F5RFY5_9BACT|nr:MAG: hypothetical protein A2502_01405 [Candidatus Edwardsbacteria bacterium RifOxyC12_full_54_24]OGF08525.1 MAG: hypothetical protein A2273_06185 [Candidatus Edwardsbacteria bacterium RifOxyA12_full_54_48]OGF11411.1 MAG: hypothetical protein A3K15_03570 [Candidatus Edwardsbacteria bacterium GWE2_54_12]OGF13346.1 MAG: hypothetical protein A2024_00035 [Candidatus Edwardsbacteria bacterium GWF2_54_11]OGF16387.1 MAG: hypothetical protein A2509_10780 [Candidatus Edwardsbacteria bacterium RIFOXYD1